MLRWVDQYGEANLAARLGFALEATEHTRDETLLRELADRRPRARVYLEPGTRGGKLAARWNVIVPEHLRPAPPEAA